MGNFYSSSGGPTTMIPDTVYSTLGEEYQVLKLLCSIYHTADEVREMSAMLGIDLEEMKRVHDGEYENLSGYARRDEAEDAVR